MADIGTGTRTGQEDSGAQGADQTSPFNWRDYLKVHPAAELFPLMRDTDPAAFRAQVEDIRANGMHVPVTFWSDDDGYEWLIDGRNRLDISAEIGALGVDRKDGEDRLVFVKAFGNTGWVPLKECDYREVEVWSEGVWGDPYALALSLNVHRRHLTAAQKDDLIAAVLKAKPETSNRQIGAITKSDKKKVAAVRTKLESTGEIPPVDKTVGADGRARRKPATRTRAAKVEPKPGSVEYERDRAEVIALNQKVIAAEQELAEHKAGCSVAAAA